MPHRTRGHANHTHTNTHAHQHTHTHTHAETDVHTSEQVHQHKDVQTNVHAYAHRTKTDSHTHTCTRGTAHTTDTHTHARTHATPHVNTTHTMKLRTPHTHTHIHTHAHRIEELFTRTCRVLSHPPRIPVNSHNSSRQTVGMSYCCFRTHFYNKTYSRCCDRINVESCKHGCVSNSFIQ